MSNIKAVLEYDGTNYSGWQIQRNTQQTVQQKLEDSLQKLNKNPVGVTAAGRTDAGAHALGQVVNFDLDVDIPADRIPAALNSELPADILCRHAEQIESEFHARYDNRGKKYRYRILNRSLRSVFVRNYVYHIYPELKLEKMIRAAAAVKGEHDFTAFQAKGSSTEDTVRTINKIAIKEKSSEYWFEFIGDGFLYKMIRIIMGTLIEIGMEKRDPDSINHIFQSREREEAGFTAPAKGLTLVEVYY